MTQAQQPVTLEALEDWKRRVNTIAACSRKDDRYRVGAELKQDIAGAIEALKAAPAAQAVEPAVVVPGQRVTVNAGALQMVVNALRRDAAEGKTARDEMADELLATVAPAPAAVAVPDERAEFEAHCASIGYCLKTNFDGTYKFDYGAEFWSGWQARAALAATPPAQMGDSPVSNVETTDPQAQDLQRDADDCFELWWADHMPNATQVEAHTAWTERRVASAAQGDA